MIFISKMLKKFKKKPSNTLFTPSNYTQTTNSFSRIFQNLPERFEFNLSFLLGAVGWFLIVLCIYIIFFSPYFDLLPSRVTITTATPGANTNLAYKSIEDLYGRKIYDIEPTKVVEKIRQNEPHIDTVDVSLSYPNWLKVILTHSPIVANITIFWVNKKLFLTKNGVFLPGSGTGLIQGVLIPTIEIISTSIREEMFIEYRKLLDKETVLWILDTLERFKITLPSFIPTRILYFTEERELHISNEKWVILLLTLDNPLRSFDKRAESIQEQLNSLTQYQERNIKKIDTGDLKYIDARVSGSLYVCSNKPVCHKHLIDIYGKRYSAEQ